MKYRDKEFGVRASQISTQYGVVAGVDGITVGALAGVCNTRLWSKQMWCAPSKHKERIIWLLHESDSLNQSDN